MQRLFGLTSFLFPPRITRTLLSAYSGPSRQRAAMVRTTRSGGRPLQTSSDSTAKTRRAVKSENTDSIKAGSPEQSPAKTSKKRASKSQSSPAKKVKVETGDDDIDAVLGVSDKPAKKGSATYGITGKSPFPKYPHPTEDECRQLNDLLSAAHGVVKAPTAVPAPSATVAGCGEVPSVLDALVRTILSANTSGANSTRAFQGLVERFGLLEHGTGKGSVNWNAVRLADSEDVVDAIRTGGLAVIKTKNIKAILDHVYEENRQKLEEGDLQLQEGDVKPKIEEGDDVLSLDYLHSYSNKDAMEYLLQFNGVGPKVASCVLLFCLQRASFAVDTHVFRLSKSLGFVPKEATRETTFQHMDQRVPDDLKYPLHVLMIRHGKSCPRCKAGATKSTPGWSDGCAIDKMIKSRAK